MPGFCYSLPAKDCQVGAKLAKIKGSVCHKCYALRGNYAWPRVKNKLQFRLNSLHNPLWIEAMTYLIRDSGDLHFRWHDSGDLQGLWHLSNIVRVAEALPEVKFWLPTREVKYVQDYLDTAKFPENLVVRISSPMIDMRPLNFPHTSTVHKGQAYGHVCPARTQDNKCGSCRACWDRTIANVSYPYH